MNLNQLVNMVVNQVIRRVVNIVVDRGFRMASRRAADVTPPKPAADRDPANRDPANRDRAGTALLSADPAQEAQMRALADRAATTARIRRRIGR